MHEVLNGDSKVKLKDIPSNSVSSILCDPPYEISFLGRKWDATGIAFDPEFWAEVYRVLKPGGHLLSFCATRTYHRMACAVEDAGFEIRDTIHWSYGCFSEDTEILTPTGWKLGVDINVGDLVAQWNPETNQISFAAAQAKYLAPWNGDMYHLSNKVTDQLITPNHRVWHSKAKRDRNKGKGRYFSGWEVKETQDISFGTTIQLPLSGYQEGKGIGGTDYAMLLSWVWTEGGFDLNGSGVHITQSLTANPDEVNMIDNLLARMNINHKRYSRDCVWVYNEVEKPYTEITWFITGELAHKIRQDLPSKKPTYNLLWNMDLEEKKAFLDVALLGDGCTKGSSTFYQKGEDELIWFQTLLACLGKRGTVFMRKHPRIGGQVGVSDKGVTRLQNKQTRSIKTHYEGMVWCVTVPTSALVVRRKGKIFISGNSGFPKSVNISTAIDKHKGLERKVLGPKLGRNGKPMICAIGYGGPGHVKNELMVTEAASPEAAAYEGWGTQLKPSHEPIAVARKPLEGNLVENVLKYGTGGMNIESARIPLQHGEIIPSRSDGNALDTQGKGFGFKRVPRDPEQERYPVNTLFSHSAFCRKTTKILGNQNSLFEEDDPEEVVVWDCHSSCPSKVVELQTKEIGNADDVGAAKFFECMEYNPEDFTWADIEYDPFIYVSKPAAYEKNRYTEAFFWATDSTRTSNYRRISYQEWEELGIEEERLWQEQGCKGNRPHLRSQGNIHATVKPVNLMVRLAKLVTPPGGTILDPFCGSGTTGVAAVLSKFDFIGIEWDEDYFEVAKARIAAAAM